MKMQKIYRFSILVVISLAFAGCVKGDDIPLPKIHPDMNKTIKGIDSNNNGVRDDVEVAIYNRYPTDKGMRQVAYQLAKSSQKCVEAGANTPIKEEVVYDIWKNQIDRGVECAFYHQKKTGKEFNRSDLYAFIEKIVLNTRDRSIADQNFNKASSGKAFEAYDWEKPCDYVGN